MVLLVFPILADQVRRAQDCLDCFRGVSYLPMFITSSFVVFTFSQFQALGVSFAFALITLWRVVVAVIVLGAVDGCRWRCHWLHARRVCGTRCFGHRSLVLLFHLHALVQALQSCMDGHLACSDSCACVYLELVVQCRVVGVVFPRTVYKALHGHVGVLELAEQALHSLRSAHITAVRGLPGCGVIATHRGVLMYLGPEARRLCGVDPE